MVENNYEPFTNKFGQILPPPENDLDEMVRKGLIRGPDHPFSDEEEREAERERVEKLRPILEELEQWRYRSLHAPIYI